MAGFLLFSTSGCHLCEQAEEILEGFNLNVEVVDIADQAQWLECYAIRIPVLYHAQTRQELGWPFTEQDVDGFIKQIGNLA